HLGAAWLAPHAAWRGLLGLLFLLPLAPQRWVVQGLLLGLVPALLELLAGLPPGAGAGIAGRGAAHALLVLGANAAWGVGAGGGLHATGPQRVRMGARGSGGVGARAPWSSMRALLSAPPLALSGFALTAAAFLGLHLAGALARGSAGADSVATHLFWIGVTAAFGAFWLVNALRLA